MHWLAKPTVLVALTASLAACGTTATTQFSPYDPNPNMKLVGNTGTHVIPEPIIVYCNKLGAFETLLNDLGAPANGNLRARAAQFLHNPPKKYGGLGGHTGTCRGDSLPGDA